ncbi:conserved hypothetical protein [Neospora caninum Liverpool]|nr:conserved hypothetical protein [Neospora caninum Liverpool]CBZ50938.1 conserved hypothetical protein [Neospora caninum Liverpool]|eukprot:XP_003880971.1 conserved hypothetical protein [Neospora caninum Liverpool]
MPNAAVIPEADACSHSLVKNTPRDQVKTEEGHTAMAVRTTSSDGEKAIPAAESRPQDEGNLVTPEERNRRDKRDYGEFLKAQIALRKERDRAERSHVCRVNPPGTTQRRYEPTVLMESVAYQNGQERERNREPSSSFSRSFPGSGQGDAGDDDVHQERDGDKAANRLKQQREYGEFLKKQVELKKLERERKREQEVAEEKKLLELARRMELTDSTSYYPSEARRRGRSRVDLQGFKGLNAAWRDSKVAIVGDGPDSLANIYSEKSGDSPNAGKALGVDLSNGERSASMMVQSRLSKTTSNAVNDTVTETHCETEHPDGTMFRADNVTEGRVEGVRDDRGLRRCQKLSSKKLYQQALDEQIREKEARKEKEKQERLKEQAEERRLLDEAFQQEKRMMRLGRRPAKSFEEDGEAFRAPFYPKASEASSSQAADLRHASSPSARTTVAVTPPPQSIQPSSRRDTGLASSDEQTGSVNRQSSNVRGQNALATWEPSNERQKETGSTEQKKEALAEQLLQLARSLTAPSSDSTSHTQEVAAGPLAAPATQPLLGKSAQGLLAPFLIQALEEQEPRTSEEQKGGTGGLAEESGDSKGEQRLDQGGRTSRGRGELSVRLEAAESLPERGDETGGGRRIATRSPPVPAIRARQRHPGEDGEAVDGRASRNAQRSEEDCGPGDVRSRFIRIDDVIDTFARSLTGESRSRRGAHPCPSVSSSPSSPSPCHWWYGRPDEEQMPTETYGLSLSTEYSNAFGNATASLTLRVSSATSSKTRGRRRGCSESRCPSRETERRDCRAHCWHDHGVNLEKLPQAIRGRFLAIRNLDNLAAPTFSFDEWSCTSPGSDQESVFEPACPPVPASCSPDILPGVPVRSLPRLKRKAFSLSLPSRSLRLGLAPPAPSFDGRVANHKKRSKRHGKAARQDASKSPGMMFLDLLRSRRAQVERLQRTGEPLRGTDRFRGRLTWEEDVMLAVRPECPLDAVARALAETPTEGRETKQTRKDTKPKRWSVLRGAVKLGHRFSRKRISFAPETQRLQDPSEEKSGLGEEDQAEEKEATNKAQERVPHEDKGHSGDENLGDPAFDQKANEPPQKRPTDSAGESKRKKK